MEFVMPVLNVVIGCIRDPSVQQTVNYVAQADALLKNLESSLADLRASKRDAEDDIKAGRSVGKVPTASATNWLKKVDDMENAVAEIKKGRGFRSRNICSKYKLGQQSAMLRNDIVALNKERTELKLVDDRPSTSIPENHFIARTIVGSEMTSKREQAVSFLLHSTVSKVGIWGMGGVGKTTLLNSIKESFKEEDGKTVVQSSSFDHVIKVTVSKEPQWERTKEEIARQVGLLQSTKEAITDHLKNKNCLFLLDNIWKPVDVTELLGVPVSSGRYKQKLVFTTRLEGTCTSMKPDKIIKLNCLEWNDAWSLFKQNADPETIDDNASIERSAKMIAKECGGLPLALSVIGRAMSSRKTTAEWNQVLTSLQKSHTMENIYKILRVSYDNLESDGHRMCFQCCSLWPDHTKIPRKELIECWMGFGLIDRYDTIFDAYEKGEVLIRSLEAACLLEPCEEDDEPCVRLHDVLRDMSLWIATDEGRSKYKWVVRAGVLLTLVSTEADQTSRNEHRWTETAATIEYADKWTDTERVSLMVNEIRSLPRLTTQCSALKSLMLQKQACPMSISSGFFRYMPALTYLDLRLNTIDELPEGIKYLLNLEYLNISSTKISSLPKWLKKLQQLKYLLCGHCFIEGVSRQLIASLGMLQVLDVFPNGSFHVSNPNELLPFGKHLKAIGMKVTSRKILSQLRLLPAWSININKLRDTSAIDFEQLSGGRGVSLQVLQIESCSSLQRLEMNGNGASLERLLLKELPKVQITWSCMEIPNSFFEKLQKLEVDGCDALKDLTWVVHLPCLGSIHIENCSGMTKLIDMDSFVDLDVEDAEESEEAYGEIQIQTSSKGSKQITEKKIFPNLKKLILVELQNLESISNQPLDFPRLRYLSVKRCPSLKKLPFKKDIIESEFLFLCEDKWWKNFEQEETNIEIKNHLCKQRARKTTPKRTN